jgi:hypothetical protein
VRDEESQGAPAEQLAEYRAACEEYAAEIVTQWRNVWYLDLARWWEREQAK